MKISEQFPSKFVRAAEIKGTRPTVTIESVVTEAMGGDTDEHKPVVYFHRCRKGLVLNWTNAQTLADAFGDDTDAWVGKSVTLYTLLVQTPSGMKDGIRIDVVQNGQPPAKPASQEVRPDAQQPEFVQSDKDSDIPF